MLLKPINEIYVPSQPAVAARPASTQCPPSVPKNVVTNDGEQLEGTMSIYTCLASTPEGGGYLVSLIVTSIAGKAPTAVYSPPLPTNATAIQCGQPIIENIYVNT